MRIQLMLLAVLLLAAGGSTLDGRQSIVLIATGDVMAQREIKRAAQAYAADGVGNEGWDGLLADVRDEIRSSDVAFCNLETPIIEAAPTSLPAEGDEYPKFFGPRALARAVRDAGFRVVSVANNHAHDMGPAGLESTQQALHDIGLRAAGFTLDGLPQPTTMTVGSRTLRFVAATLKMNKALPTGFTAWGVNEINPTWPVPLLNEVRLARSRGEEVVVSLHWGREWGHEPDPLQRTLAHALCEAGAVAVMAHHAHIAQEVELYRTASGRRCAIAWSLGNLVAIEPQHPDANLGMLLRLTLDDDGTGQLQVTECRWQPTWSLRTGRRLHVIPLDEDTDLARQALLDPVCADELEAATRRIGPREVR